MSEIKMIWRHMPTEDASVDPGYDLLVNGVDVGIYIQDSRAYSGGYGVNRLVGAGHDLASHHHGHYRSLRAAKVAGERLFLGSQP